MPEPWKVGDNMTFQPMVTFRCPCGGVAFAGTILETQAQCVIHKMPHCTYFLDLDPVEYLRWARTHGATAVTGN